MKLEIINQRSIFFNNLKRYFIFLIGISFCSMGVALFIKSDIGVSPITAIPYALYIILPMLSAGTWTALFNGLLIIVQPLIDKKTRKRDLVQQIIATCIFGVFIDISLAILSNISVETYFLKTVLLVLGCCSLAFGAYIEYIADVALLPLDAFLSAVSKVTKRNVGKLRVICDISMTFGAIAVGIIGANKVIGVREGTIIAAFLTGAILTFCFKRLRSLALFIRPELKDSDIK